MAKPDPKDVIELLACDIVSRPGGAPMPSALAPYIRSIERTVDAISIAFAPEAADDVAAFAAAESICCAGIDWNVERNPTVRLTVVAPPAQLDVIEQMFTPA
jgi:hypothetical protein